MYTLKFNKYRSFVKHILPNCVMVFHDCNVKFYCLYANQELANAAAANPTQTVYSVGAGESQEINVWKDAARRLGFKEEA